MTFIEKIKKYTKEIVGFIIVLTLIANIVSYYKSTSLNKNRLELTSVTLLNNTQYTISKEKPILIHFWATWCPICSIEASNIQYISEKFEVITIAVDSTSKKEIQNYLEKNNLDFKVVNDLDKQYAKKFNISVFPTTFIYDKNRNLVFSEVGYSSTFGLYLRMIWASL
jgi:thiol-disulfide isomerase/thioredoxin